MKVTQRTLSKCSDLKVLVILQYSSSALCDGSSAFYQGHDSGGECNVPYINRFAMPRPGPDQPW